MKDGLQVAVLACLVAVGTGGGALVGWSFGKNLPGKGPTSSPVVVRGGSVSGIAANGWHKNNNVRSADLSSASSTPNNVTLYGVDSSGSGTVPTDIPMSSDTNWTITLTFSNTDALHPKPTQLQVCSSNPCSTTGNITGNSVYLIDPSDTFKVERINRQDAHLHMKLSQCLYTDPLTGSPDPDPNCNHISNVTVAGFSGYDGDYGCVDGACDIAIAHK